MKKVTVFIFSILSIIQLNAQEKEGFICVFHPSGFSFEWTCCNDRIILLPDSLNQNIEKGKVDFTIHRTGKRELEFWVSDLRITYKDSSTKECREMIFKDCEEFLPIKKHLMQYEDSLSVPNHVKKLNSWMLGLQISYRDTFSNKCREIIPKDCQELLPIKNYLMLYKDSLSVHWNDNVKKYDDGNGVISSFDINSKK